MTDEFEDLYSAYRTTLQMMEDRGYFVSKQLKEESKQEFKDKLQKTTEQTMVLVFESPEDQKKILVYFVKMIANITTQDITTLSQKIREK